MFVVVFDHKMESKVVELRDEIIQVQELERSRAEQAIQAVVSSLIIVTINNKNHNHSLHHHQHQYHHHQHQHQHHHHHCYHL